MPELAINEYAIFTILLFNSYIECICDCTWLILHYLHQMFELQRKTFIPSHKTFAKKSILSANKILPLQRINALYVRVETFAKQSFLWKVQ